MDISKFKNKDRNKRYEKYISSKKYDTTHIEETVNTAFNHIQSGEKSFVIYGQPQSGKTDMMIGLCSKLFDEGTEIIIVLVQSITLLENQNRTRFAESGINPGPKWFAEIMEPDYKFEGRKHLLFCTKETRHLRNLIAYLKTDSAMTSSQLLQIICT